MATPRPQAGPAIEALLQAAHDAPHLAERLTDVSAFVATLHQEIAAKTAELREQRVEMVRMAQTIAALEASLRTAEQLNVERVGTIVTLKTRLARAAEENEALYRLTNHEVGDATTRHLAVTRVRDLLDLATPLPLRTAVAGSPHPLTGAPHQLAAID